MKKILSSSVKSAPNLVRWQSTGSILSKSFYNDDHRKLQDSARKLIDKHVNPYADEWEKDEIFPAKEVFKAFGDAGFLGINKPVEYGGQGLDYKYQMAFLEATGHIRASGVAMGIGVQTDCSTPALARFGSDQLKSTFLKPAISGAKIFNSFKVWINQILFRRNGDMRRSQ